MDLNSTNKYLWSAHFEAQTARSYETGQTIHWVSKYVLSTYYDHISARNWGGKNLETLGYNTLWHKHTWQEMGAPVGGIWEGEWHIYWGRKVGGFLEEAAVEQSIRRHPESAFMFQHSVCAKARVSLTHRGERPSSWRKLGELPVFL